MKTLAERRASRRKKPTQRPAPKQVPSSTSLVDSKPTKSPSKKRRVIKRRSPSKKPPNPEYEAAKALYNTPAYRDWRDFIFFRDEYTCQMCEAKETYLEAHHIKPKYKFPELTLDKTNGITLCKECHQQLVNKSESSFYYIFSRIVFLNTLRLRRKQRGN